jgi:uroporphyrinogen decarboxylase
MNSRDRTLSALHHVEPDRVPFDLWLSSGMTLKLERARRMTASDLCDAYDVDLRYIEGPAYIGPPLRRFADGAEADIWGVPRVPVRVAVQDGIEDYKEVVFSPLAAATTVEEIEDYPHWPSPDWFDYSGIAAQCAALRSQGRAVVFMGDRLNRVAQLKPAMYLRGVEQILLDLRLAPELAKAIFARIRAFYCAYAERIFEAADGQLDILLMGDDFGTQRGPMMSPAMWAEFLGPGFAEFVGLAKSYGLWVMHHTCGSVRPLIPLMIERGLDVLQSLQPEAADMDPWELKATFGEQLAFHGGISIQRTLPFGTREEIRREVQDRVAALAPGGGYILCTSHNIQADTPMHNVEALLEAYRDYGARANSAP